MSRTLLTGTILRSGSIPTSALGGGVVSGSAQTVAHLENQVINVGVISASGHIVPTENEVYDLGSTTKQFRDLYLSGSTIYLGGLKLTEENGGLSVKRTIRINNAIHDDPVASVAPLSGSFTGSFYGNGTDIVGVQYTKLTQVPANIVSQSSQVILNSTTGTLEVNKGGTGHTTYTNGQLLIGNTESNTLTKTTLTAGEGIIVTNGAGTITIAATSTGAVTSVSGTGTVSGLTLSGTVTSSGNLTLGGALSLTTEQVTSALGYTPYNVSNPAGYTTNTGTVTSVNVSAGTGLSGGGTITTSGTITLTNAGVTSNVAGTGISVSGATGAVTITNSSPNATHTGDVTGATALTIVNDVVTNAKAANMAVNTIKGRITAGTGDPEDLTASQVRTILNVADGATANTGTVTSVATTGTVSGLTLTGGTITTAGTITLGGTLSLTSANVTTALGYTPYNATNPNGYTTNTGTVTSVAGTGTASGLTLSGTVTNSGNLTLSGTVNSLAAGTYGISISGNASGATTVFLQSLGTGSVNVNNGNLGVYRNENGSGAAIAYAPVLHVGGGDTMWQVQGTYGTTGNGTFYFRQGYSGSWGNWLTMLSSANYNSYSPTLTGTGASGTWGISITGTAANITAYTINQSVGTGNSPTFNDLYVNQWFRNNTTNTGLYNQVTTQHWSSQTNGYWDASSTTSVSSIRFYTGGHVSALRGYVYADTSNSIGFLNSGGNWRLRVVGDDYTLADGSSMRAPIFYDSNNTGYYADPASTSIFNILQFGTSTNSGRFDGSSSWGVHFRTDSGYINFGPANGGHAHIYTDRPNFYFNAPLTVNDGSYINQGDIRSAIFYDRNDTAYYIDPNSTSESARLRGRMVIGPNNSWGDFLQVGGNGREFVDNTTYASVVTTDGNLHLDAASNHEMYLNYYDGNSIRFGNGANGVTGRWNSSGNLYVGVDGDASYRLQVSGTGYATSDFRAPIFYDSDNTAYYIDGNNTSRLNQLTTDGRVVIGGNFSNNAYNAVSSTRLHFGGGDSDADGNYYIGTNLNNYGGNYSKLDLRWHTGIRMGAQAGYGGIRIFNNEDLDSQIASFGETDANVRISNILFVSGDVRSPIFYDSANTGFYVDPASTSVMNRISTVRADNWLYLDNNYGHSVVGVYESTRLQGVFAMGDSYKLAANGTNAGSLYGMAWSHPNAGGIGGANNLNDHGLLIINNGTFRAAISSRIVASEEVRGTLFRDYNDSGYYVDPASTSVMNQINSTTRTRWGMPGNFHTNRETFTNSSQYHTGTNGWDTQQGTWATAWKGGCSGWDIWGTSTDHPQGAGYVHAQGIISGLHYTETDGSSAYGWMMVGASNATDNRYWARGKWGGTTSAWKEFAMYGGGGSGDLRASIFYDSDNTGFYTDPASTSNLNSVSIITLNGHTLNADNYLGRYGGSYYQVNTWLQMNGPHGLYWPNYYGAHLYPNDGSTYTQFRISGVKNSYSGIWDAHSAVNIGMYDGAGNGGVYREANGRWYFYHLVSNNCMGIGTSATSSAYGVYVVKGGYFDGRVDGTIFYDANNTGFYVDPASTSVLATLNVNRLFIGHGNIGDPSNSEGQVFHKSGGGLGLAGIEIDCWTGFPGSSYPNNFQIGFRMSYDKRLYVWQDLIQYYSDERLKNKTGFLDGALDAIKNWTPFKYVDNDIAAGSEYTNRRPQIGLSAQEVQQYYPELVELAPFDMETDFSDPTNIRKYSKSGQNYLTLNYPRLIPVLIQAIKEQQAKIEALEAQINNL